MTQIPEKHRCDPHTYAIIGAGMEVHRELGHGFLEKVYADALEFEFDDRRLPFLRESELKILYKQRKLLSVYRADFLCFDRMVVELKAMKTITDIERAQLLNDLKATGYEIGLILNFGAASLEYQRMVKSAKSA